jgi:hypothetical protein
MLMQRSYGWTAARAYELNALTNMSSIGRETNLAGMLFYLGHVIHLNQDLSVPAHVRNDNHGVAADNGVFELFVMWTENFGAAQCASNPQWFTNHPSHSGWSWWQDSAGFQKLEDFWNRDMLRTNGQDTLVADARNSSRIPLSLSEFCNGNFISEDASYGDFYNNTNAKHWFQFPRLADTTQPNLKRLRWGAGELEVRTNTIVLENGKSGRAPYLSKIKSGIYVTNHSALRYEAVRNPGRMNTYQMHAMLSLNDSNVLQEYHSILLPKAVEYSAGILDYFFRGTMEVTVSWGGTNAPNFTNTVQNTSGQDFHGGTFFLLKETNDVRIPVLQTNLADIITDPNGIFTNGTSLDIICPGSPTNKYLLLYQGTIGWTNNAALDLVDSNICIAAARPKIKHTRTYTYWNPLSALGLPPGSTVASNLVSDDFSFVPTSGNVEVVLNGGSLDDSGTIGFDDNGSGGLSFPFTGTCGDLASIEPNTIVPASGVYIDGNHLRVNIRATDELSCSNLVFGWLGERHHHLARLASS